MSNRVKIRKARSKEAEGWRDQLIFIGGAVKALQDQKAHFDDLVAKVEAEYESILAEFRKVK